MRTPLILDKLNRRGEERQTMLLKARRLGVRWQVECKLAGHVSAGIIGGPEAAA